jgi:hypothetical protein
LSAPTKWSAAAVETNFSTEAGIRRESGEFLAITVPSAGFIISNPGDARFVEFTYLSSEWSAYEGILPTKRVAARSAEMNVLRTNIFLTMERVIVNSEISL